MEQLTDMLNTVIESLTGEFGARLIGVVITAIFLVVGIGWAQRRMRNMGGKWEDVAQQNGLQFAVNPFTYDYGLFVGEHSFAYPGMVGQYRGRDVQVQSSAGLKGREAGRFVFEAALSLKAPVPYSALVHKRAFEDIVKKHITKDTRTDNRAIDRQFKVRSENTGFVVQVFERVAVGDWLKQQKYLTGHILFDGQQLIFSGAKSGYSAPPEVAIALLNMLCDVAEAAERM
jgi:hypothetical protein